MLMKNVKMVSPAISMQTMGQCWAHAIFCSAPETPGTLVPEPRGNGSMRMKSSPCLGELGMHTEERPHTKWQKHLRVFFLCQSAHLSFTWLILIIKILNEKARICWHKKIINKPETGYFWLSSPGNSFVRPLQGIIRRIWFNCLQPTY